MPLGSGRKMCEFPDCGKPSAHRHHKQYVHGNYLQPCFCHEEPLIYLCEPHHREITFLNKKLRNMPGGVQCRRENILDLWMRKLITVEQFGYNAN